MNITKAATIQGGKAPIYTSCRLEPCHVGSKSKIRGSISIHVAISPLLLGILVRGRS